MYKFQALHDLMKFAIEKADETYWEVEDNLQKKHHFWNDVFNSLYRQAKETRNNAK